jgi:hypothetical protein
MKASIATNTLYPAVDYKALHSAMCRLIATEPKDRETALKWLVGTGMHGKDGKLKKQFR